MGLLSRLRAPAGDGPIWALDLETSGLEPRHHEILSAGMVPIRGGTIRWGERYHSLVRPGDPAAVSPEGIGAHQIVPAELAAAPPLAEVLAEIDRRLREGVVLLHHAPLDLAFLRLAYRRCGRRWPRPRVIDTVDLLLRRQRRGLGAAANVSAAPVGSLTAARRQLGLPPHDAHHALADALATAELYLALRGADAGWW